MTRSDIKLRSLFQYSKNPFGRSRTVSVVLTNLILIDRSSKGILQCCFSAFRK